jgi:hypothetical protein
MKHSIPFPQVSWSRYSRLFLLFCLSWCSSIINAQDCDLACVGSPDQPLQVVISDQCQVALTNDMLLPDIDSCPGDKRLTVRDSLNNLITDGFNFVQFSANAFVGSRLSVTITDQTTGTLCVGTIRVVDNSAPTITNCPNVTVSCLDNTSPEVIGEPTIGDNCDMNLALTSIDNITFGDCLSNIAAVILREWTVTDHSGLTASCTQEITVTRASFMDVTFPDDITLPCDDPSADPAITGIPMLNGTVLMHGDMCGLDVGFADDTTFICNNYMYQINRTWTVIENCTDFFGEDVQTILVSDDQGPTLNCPTPNQLTYTSDPGVCSATIALPIITGTDNCGANITFSVTSSYGATDFSPVSGVAPGEHIVVYQGLDECGNTSTCTVQLTVTDDVAPVAACDDQIVASIASSGYGIILSSTFNEGSSDNCGPVFLKAKRNIGAGCNLANGDDSSLPGYQEWFDDRVIFCCEDIPNSPISVTLRVYETDPGTGPVDPSRESGGGDLVGHFTDCQSIVTLQDGTAPIFEQCPQPLTINCYDEQDNLGIYGSPVVRDNCGFTLDSTFVTSFNECGVGTITRTWTATDNYEHESSCSQVINVINNEALTENDIVWPINVELYECGASTADEDLPLAARNPTVNWAGCGTVAINSTESVFNTVPGACFKILRTWTVIDWCNFDPSNPNGGGQFTHTQQIKVFDQEDPIIICPESVTVNVSSNCTTGYATLGLPTADDCSTQITFTNNSPYANNNGADASGNYPVGTTTVQFIANDNCFNNASCTTTVTVGDTEAPNVSCIVGLTTNVMPMGDGVMGSINASALVGSVSDNCDPTSLLKFTISRPGDGTNGVPTATSVDFDCYDAGQAAEVILWASDSQDNVSTCLTVVSVQDPNNHCVGQTGEGMISGGVLTEDGNEVENVMIMVSGNDPSMMYTHIDGSFMFEDLSLGQDYSVIAQNNENLLNGVTTFDLILIGKHILGTSILNSPYKLIAADVDRSGHISTLDIIKLRKLILNISSELPNNNTSWRFIDAAYVFADPTNPFMGYFPELHNINDLSGPEMHADFVAIKVGDVNGSAIPNSMMADGDDRSSSNPLELSIGATSVEANETVDIPFKARYMNEWMGYQFTLEYDPGALEVLEIIPGDLPNLYPEENFHFYDDRAGLITTVWNEYGQSANSKEMTLFTLRCTAKQAGSIKEWLYLSSRVTKAEAYTQDGEAEDINLSFFTESGAAEVSSNFELFQNRPNPWNNSTIIPFQLDPGGDARLSVYDMAGKLVYEVAEYFSEGYHEISIRRSDLPAIGLFYYTLEAGDQRATRKMVLTD